MPRGRPKGSKNNNSKNKIVEPIEIEVQPELNSESEIKIDSNLNTEQEQKIKSEPEVIVDTNDTDDTNTATKKRQKSDDDKYPRCERCGDSITSTVYTCNTSSLTSRADYFRDAPAVVKLCSKCSIGLSKVVDEYLVNNGKGAIKPWASIKYHTDVIDEK